MTVIEARDLGYKELNDHLKKCNDAAVINGCIGQRFIASGQGNKEITINGTPGNALGAYLNGARIIVNGNVQDAVGDTMNDGAIIVNGNAGDTLGYAMRGGKIFVKGNAGYRTGIHMKEYGEKKPLIIVGGKVGSFLGEYLAGGVIVILGIGSENESPVGNFTGTGMHGGKMFVRSKKPLASLPAQVSCTKASKEDLACIEKELKEYCDTFGFSYDELMKEDFYMLTPNAKNPYKKLYIPN